MKALMRGIEHAGHAHHAVLGKAADAIRGLHHGIERIGDHDEYRAGRELDDVLDDGFDDLVIRAQQIVAAHAGLAREAGGDHDDVAVRGLAVIAAGGGDAGDARVRARDRGRFEHVERFAGGRAFNDIREDDVGEFVVHDALRGG